MTTSSIAKLGDKLDHQAQQARQILMAKGAIKADPELQEGRYTVKQTVGAVFLGVDQPTSGNPDDIELAFGLHHISPKDKPVIQSATLIGGGIPSMEEESLQAQLRNPAFTLLGTPHSQNAIIEYFRDTEGNLPKALPLGGKLFFMIQAMNLVEHGEMIKLSYDVTKGIMATLESGLKVRMGQEIGQEATAGMEIIAHLDGPKLITPVPFGSPDNGRYSSQMIAARIQDEDVYVLPNGRVNGLWTRISEEGFLVRARLDELAEHAESTEDVRSIVRMTLGELIAQADLAIANGKESWDGWSSADNGIRPRNDSLLTMASRAAHKISKGEVTL